MANKPLKSIKFPDLSDTYTIPTEPSDIGAIPAPSNPSEGDSLVWNGSAWDADALVTKADTDIIADVYSASSTYAVGDYVIYNGSLYKCNTDISTAEAWTAAHWTQVIVTDELSGGTEHGIPSGGTTGQVLKKASNDDYDVEWGDESGGSYSLIVTAVTQDSVTVTGQTVTVRSGSASGQIFATKAYEGQPVSFALPVGFTYFVSISDTLSGHFNPTTATGIIVDTDVAVTLTYSDFNSIATIQDLKAALDAGLDLSSLVGLKTITDANEMYEIDIADLDSTGEVITCVTHYTLPDQRQFDAPQALAWFENGLAAGSYYFTNYYFTLVNAIPSGGQLKATTSAFQTYASPTDTATVETGTVSTTEISGATSLGTTASDSGTYALNHMDRVSYGSNNYAESGLLEWLNSDDPAGTVIIGKTKFCRPYETAKAGFLVGWDADDLACIDDTVWRCSANNTYECPASMGGISVKGNPYTVTQKFGLLSEMEVYGSYGGVPDGSTLLDLYNGASDVDRIKYYNNSARAWWLRSPSWSDANYERTVNTSGAVAYNKANSSHGVAVAFKIRKSA